MSRVAGNVDSVIIISYSVSNPDRKLKFTCFKLQFLKFKEEVDICEELKALASIFNSNIGLEHVKEIFRALLLPSKSAGMLVKVLPDGKVIIKRIRSVVVVLSKVDFISSSDTR